ncbi:TPA: hypothetical protein N0F65_007208 [Lagenidium giganteum]|uniref:USP8 dimerisation domain-containing protein n=1 Tax=Lagenidium giganteum TaxID=4803 RepID=A0AAV2ZA63_9STRA|nr:TPA: hypothetical protein N0F65_007208 [Lagenidium giganteum]
MDAKAATAGVGRDHVDGHAAAVAERVSTRRAGLQPFCQVEPVKPHLRLRSYFQLARQLYRQSEVYCDEQSWDKAYVMMAKFIKICSKVITAHPEYDLPSNEHEREWIHTQAREALSLFDAILDGMEAEERDLYQYERQMEDMVASVSQKPSAKADRPQSVATASALQSATTSLEGRLQALKLAPSSPPSPPPSTPSLDPPPAPPSRSVPLARSYPASKAYRITPQTKTVNYPSIGKASWIPSKALGRQSSRHSISPFSRRLSIEALESFSSASTRTLQIPSHVIAQFTNIAAPNTNMPPNGIETCGILAGVLDNGALRITTLIIPKQEGSADMCTMKNEEELFTYCDTNNLLTLGWIHIIEPFVMVCLRIASVLKATLLWLLAFPLAYGALTECLGIEFSKLSAMSTCGVVYDATKYGLVKLNQQLQLPASMHFNPVTVITASASEGSLTKNTLVAVLVLVAPLGECNVITASCEFNMNRTEIYSLLLTLDSEDKLNLDGYKHHAISASQREQLVKRYDSGDFYGTDLASGIFETPNLPLESTSNSSSSFSRSPLGIFVVIASAVVSIGLLFHHRRRLHNGYAPIVIMKRGQTGNGSSTTSQSELRRPNPGSTEAQALNRPHEHSERFAV